MKLGVGTERITLPTDRRDLGRVFIPFYRSGLLLAALAYKNERDPTPIREVMGG